MSASKPLKIVDLGRGMSAALVARMMIDLGGVVTRVEPDSGDPFYDVYPAYSAWHDGSERATEQDLADLIAEADVLIVGGEDFPDSDGIGDVAALASRNPRLITLRIGGMIDRAGTEKIPATDILVQAATGFVWEQFTDRPIHFTFGGPTFGAALSGLIGIWAALLERQRSGLGQIVTATMEEGQALFWPQIWITASQTTNDFENFSPRDVRHLIFETGDAKYVHFTMGVPGAVAKLYGVLGIDVDVDPNDRGGMDRSRGIRNFFGNRDLIEPAVLKWERDALLAELWKVGMTAEAVLAPGDCINDEQITANELVRSAGDGTTVVAGPTRIQTSCAREKPAALPEAGDRPLEGVRVVDLGNFVAGPYGSRLLADLGADVVKVEPLSGLQHLTGLRNVWASNRGKRSICIDAKHPKGAEIIRKLASWADAAQHNFRVGVAPRLGVDPASLQAINDDIVTLETTAYGTRGPKALLPGFDMGMQALSGHEVRAGGRGNIPLWYRSPFLDYGTGALSAIAMLAGLYKRNETGCAVALENSLLSTGLYFLSAMVVGDNGEVRGVPSNNPDMTGFSAWERLYKTSDGWIAVAARSDEMAGRLANCFGLGHALGPKSTWTDATGDRFAEVFARMTVAQAMTALNSARVWAVPCGNDAWPALSKDEAARERGFVVDVADPRYEKVTAIGRHVNLSRTAPRPADTAPHYAPMPGEHTRSILKDLGYSEAEIDALYDERAIA